jgi:hypothetical protein
LKSDDSGHFIAFRL